MSGKLVRIEGEVWCDTHGTVHEDTIDPYGEGRDNGCLSEMYGWRLQKSNVHRTLYYRTRKGDSV